jgi:TetR/AcrR family transcriptional regulator
MNAASPRVSIDDLSVRRVVGTVLELAAQCGLDSVSEIAIANRMGVPPSAVAQCVPNTHAIWDAVMDWLEDQLGKIHLAAARQGHASPLSKLGRILFDCVLLIQRHPALGQILSAGPLQTRFPGLRERIAEIWAAHEERVVDLIEQAKQQHLVPQSLPAQDAATLFFCVMSGLGLQFMSVQQPTRLLRETGQVFALYLRAIANLRPPALLLSHDGAING